jgi:hypothetical protein
MSRSGRDQAVGLLRSSEPRDVHSAASILTGLPDEIRRVIDANLLAGHQQPVVRQASSLMCLHEPERYRELLLRLAADPDFRVRRTLAHAAGPQPRHQNHCQRDARMVSAAHRRIPDLLLPNPS